MSPDTEKTHHVVDEQDVGSISSIKAVNVILENTKELLEEERQLGVIDAMKQYPKAMFWSVFFSVAVIMTGYDAQLVTSFYAMPSFIAKYGQYYNGNKEISAAWQSGLGMGNPIGQLLGSLVVAWPSEKWGRKRVLIVCNLLIAALIFMQFFANNIQVLCVGEILAGLLWGCFVVIAPSYASEVSPLALRGILTAFINMAFVIGQFVAQGVAAGLESRTDKWAYKAPFAIQWIWCLILFVGLPFAPESPWYLVRKGRRDEAKKALQRLAWDKAGDGVSLEKTLNVIEQTDLLERELHTSSTYMDCFKGSNLRRTEICCMVYLIQVICGNPLMGYCNYFFIQAGLDNQKAFYMGVGTTAIGFVGTALTWVVLSYAGRRTIFNYGLSVMTLLLFIIAILDCAPSYSSNLGFSWAQASLLDVWTFLYQLTVGPLTFVIIGEISSTKLVSIL
ncbi:Mal31p [Sugiyamaella lignohabitans]|uniref:Mal31p n=1 Tax=Sugiyamaella lignohabitans TaxID=796027 RepID=A0A167E5Q6_9ASCO|nr:Mal31p [Sugiyamaella lignohabitans]ANB13674.1 Mal31p [Sugiyamaella lignohabitans]